MDWIKGAIGAGAAIGSTALQKEEKQKVPNFPICCPILYFSLSECPGFKRVLCLMGLTQFISTQCDFAQAENFFINSLMIINIFFYKKTKPVFAILLSVNLIGAILAISCGFAQSVELGMDYLSMLIISGFMAIFAPFFGFFLQFWPIYMACSSKMALKYWLFFLTQVVAIIFFLISFAGIHFIGSWYVTFCAQHLIGNRYTNIYSFLYQ